jgi:hypothetical protein
MAMAMAMAMNELCGQLNDFSRGQLSSSISDKLHAALADATAPGSVHKRRVPQIDKQKCGVRGCSGVGGGRGWMGDPSRCEPGRWPHFIFVLACIGWHLQALEHE